jgi:hypothetical protein
MNDLEWWQWLCWTSREIQLSGYNPADRVKRIGHRRPLSAKWSLTVGMWGVRTPTEIMHVVGLNPDSTERGTFDVFKHRHKLWCRNQLERFFAEEVPVDERVRLGRPWTQCDLATQVHGYAYVQMSQERYGPKKGLLPLERIHYRFHIMPVEGYLYCANVEHLLVEHQIPYDKWFKMEAEERQALWDKGIDPANPEPLIVQCAEQVRYAVHKRKHARKDEESLVH